MRLTLLILTSLAAAADLPTTIRVEPAKMTFHLVSFSKGDAGKVVRSEMKRQGGRVVKIRAFTLGDPAALKATIAKSTAGPKPVVDVIQVGGLADGVQTLFEFTSESSKGENLNGLVFISGQASTAPLEKGKSATPVLPLAEKSLTSLKAALSGNGAGDVLRIACFTSSLADEAAVHKLMAEAFPVAAVSVVQVQSVPTNQEVECEAVARLKEKPAEAVQLVNPTKAAFAQAVKVAAPLIILTSTEWSEDARGAFGQVKSSLESEGSGLDQVFYSYAYPSSAGMLQKYRDVRWDFLVRAKAPASTNLVFEGANQKEKLGIDVMALPR